MKTLFVLLLLVFTPNFAQSQDQMLTQAIALEAQGDYAQAFLLLEQALYSEGERELDIRILLREYYLALDLPVDFEQNEFMLDILMVDQSKKKSPTMSSSSN
jgi:hypothetical protein